MLKKIVTIIIIAFFIIPTFQTFATTNTLSTEQEASSFKLDAFKPILKEIVEENNLIEVTNLVDQLINQELLNVTKNRLITENWNSPEYVETVNVMSNEAVPFRSTAEQTVDSLMTNDVPNDSNQQQTNTTDMKHPELNITPANALHIAIFILIFFVLMAVSIVYLARKK